jgi:hypothetical protein
MTNAQKVLPIALSLAALATVGAALARTIHQPATQDSQRPRCRMVMARRIFCTSVMERLLAT